MNIYFRAYKKIEKGSCEGDGREGVSEFEQPLLWIHQEAWQQELMLNYGNTMTLIDATYKTTRYELPLFFLSAKTNVGYSVIAEFVTHYERMEDIAETLQIIKDWNPNYSPKFFMSDYSEAKMLAVEKIFPDTKVYLCDFHREQSWERWVKNHENEVSPADQAELLELLRSCAWASPSDSSSDLPFDANYQKALKILQDSHIWRENKRLRYWFSTF